MTLQLDRRIFLVSAGAGLALGIAGCGPKGASRAGGEINMWVAVAPDGIVTVRLNATDIGQGAQTGIAQIVADEMDADWTKLRVEMAPVTARYLIKGDDKGYYTGGSSSIADQFAMYAQAGAAARMLLIQAAATQWGVAPAACRASRSIVSHRVSGNTRGYGALAAAASRLDLPPNVTLKKPQARGLIGVSVPRLDIPDKVRGATVYGIDVKRPGMRIATIAQCPYFGGALSAVDEAPALAVKGVETVLRFDDAVAVVARNFWAAKKGLDALRPAWRKPADPVASRDAMYARLGAEAASAALTHSLATDKDRKPQTAARVAAALGRGKTFAAEYQVQLLAHAGMEPMNATAEVSATHCELWAPMQSQGDMLKDVAAALNLPTEAVTLHTTAAGGGFGRRLRTDYGVQAARIARQVGKPVKLIWTREEDFAHDFYRPASVARVTAALNDDATIRAIDYRGATTGDTAAYGFLDNYKFADGIVRQQNVAMSLPIGAWRSVDPSITIFLIESFVDEIAHAHGIDPLAYRKTLIGGNARAQRVIDTAAAMANWGHPPAGRAQGIAYFSGAWWGTLVAQVVELSVDAASRITLHKVSCAIDPGLAINPNQIAAQAEGGIILGLSAALGEEITLKDGRVEQTNFDSYALPRLRSVPDIAVQILESPGAAPGGVGEPPVPPIMPALANALFAATAKRIRTLPLSRSGFSV